MAEVGGPDIDLSASRLGLLADAAIGINRIGDGCEASVEATEGTGDDPIRIELCVDRGTGADTRRTESLPEPEPEWAARHLGHRGPTPTPGAFIPPTAQLFEIRVEPEEQRRVRRSLRDVLIEVGEPARETHARRRHGRQREGGSEIRNRLPLLELQQARIGVGSGLSDRLGFLGLEGRKRLLQ